MELSDSPYNSILAPRSIERHTHYHSEEKNDPTTETESATQFSPRSTDRPRACFFQLSTTTQEPLPSITEENERTVELSTNMPRILQILKKSTSEIASFHLRQTNHRPQRPEAQRV